METPSTDRIEDLLPRYCSGEATVEECRQVEEWIRQSDENYRIAKQIHTLYLTTDTMQVLSKVDTEKALSSVCQKMSKNSVRPKVTLVTWLQRVAAILFIPLLTIFVYQNLKPRPVEIARMIEVKTNPGMTTTVQLPDGSVVHLNSESRLSYPSFFDKDKRKVTLQGEAFFEVAHKEYPFVVHSPLLAIKVLGTKFNVKAYSDEKSVVTLAEGKVEVETNDRKNKLTLKPNEQISYSESSGITLEKSIDTNTVKSWMRGEGAYVQQRLDGIIRDLERKFDVKIILTDHSLGAEVFTCRFKDTATIEQVLHLLKETRRLDYSFEGEQIRIFKPLK